MLNSILAYTPRGYYYKKYMITELKKRALHRSKILEGQMRGVQRMIENEQYCMDIITQTLAIQKSIDSLNKLLIENHLRTHVTDSLKSNTHSEKTIIELLSLYALHEKGK